MEDLSRSIAALLLRIGAVKIQAQQAFTWASGWKSPIYCDNRKILSYPKERTEVSQAFAKQIQTLYPETDCIAGVATGAIAHGALVAQILNLPFIYVRSAPKSHGLSNTIEGELVAGSKIVVIEDLISTGGSSLQAVAALREAGMEVIGMLAIFTYGFEISVEKFKNANCPINTLSNYQSLIKLALSQGLISNAELESLQKWRIAPADWGK